MAVTDGRTSKEIYANAKEVSTPNGTVFQDSKTGDFLPNDPRKLKRKPLAVSANASARTIMSKLKQLHKAKGDTALNKIIDDKPVEFYKIYIRLIEFYDDSGNRQQQATADHGQALLSAFQSGRLSEQLAALVQAGKREVNRLQQAANDASKPPAADAREV